MTGPTDGFATDNDIRRKRFRKMLAPFCVVLTAVATTFGAIFTGIQAYMALRTGERQVRAYMTAFIEEVPTSSKNNDTMSINMSFKNYGQTPAFHIRPFFHADAERLSQQEIVERLVPHDNTFHLGNGQQFGYEIELDMTAVAYHRLVQSGGKYYVYGAIRYDDVFDKAHTSNFCFQLQAEKKNARLVPCNFFDDFD